MLETYLYYNEKENYHDIHVVSESFFSDLINLLYGYQTVNANKSRKNMKGFDLIDEKNKLLIQVSSSSRPDKIIHTFEQIESILNNKTKESQGKTENNESMFKRINKTGRDMEKEWGDDSYPNLNGYRLMFMFLKREANLSNIQSYKGRSGKGYSVPHGIDFDKNKDILCLDSLCQEVEYLSEIEEKEKIAKLEHFMEDNSNLFFWRIDPPNPKDGVKEIIGEYYENYVSPLFMHANSDSQNKDKVILKNLYVEPKFFRVDRKKDLDQEGIYSKQIDAESSSCERSGSREKFSSIKLFSDFIFGKNSEQFLFIDGDAAVGKTSLVSWLCYHYTKQDDECRAIFCDKKMICIRLRELKTESLKESIERCVLDYLKVNSRAKFNEDYKDAVFILDGADEISMVDRVSPQTIERFLLDFRKEFKHHKIICISRPKFISTEQISQSGIGFQQVTIEHFDENMRKEWLLKYERTGETISDETKEYIIGLCDEGAEGVADTPLALYLLVAGDISNDIKNNQWALYHEIFYKAIIKTRYNENLKYSNDHPLFTDDISEDVYNLVEEIAFTLFKNSDEERYYIASEELKQIIDGYAAYSRNGDLYRNDFLSLDMRIGGYKRIVRKACMLCSYWKKDSNEGALEFYHNNIRDFFFSEYIYNRMLKIDEYENQKYIDTFLERASQVLCYGYVADTTWEQTFRFIYLKLQYYLEQNHTEDIHYAKRIKDNYNDILCTAVYRFLMNPDLSSSKCRKRIFAYSAYKHTFVNMILLMKAILLGSGMMEKTKFWKNEDQKKEWERAELLKDWNELFSRGIHGITLSDELVYDNNSAPDSYLDSKSDTLTGSSVFDWSGFDFNRLVINNGIFNTIVINNGSFINNNLRDAFFYNSELRNVVFSGADLSNACFAHSIVEDCVFNGATIKECKLFCASFKGANESLDEFFLADYSSIELVHLASGVKIKNLQESTLRNCVMNGADFRNGLIQMCVFTECSLQESIFSNVEIHGCDFSNCCFDKCDMIRTRFTNCTFHNCQFNDIINMENLFYISCIFEKCDFKESNLKNVGMTKCTLDRVSMDSLIDSKAQNVTEVQFVEEDEGESYYIDGHLFI